ncbi:hypothetical protein A0256_16940 [Mucilaginibacter sp. PAMC 26640]|nr:hypothetical protein A0256_16940 [Mucilaginibacter sp. PAMC 26640]
MSAINFDWNKIFLDDLNFSFALEILMRTIIMFIMVLVILRLSGKKGVRQLSLFEVAIIISLGSAPGDPMFNEDTPIVPALIVFLVIVLVYRFITWLAVRSERIETLLEGDPEYVIEDGRFVLLEKNKHTFAKDEFLSEMRQKSIEHLGQVRVAILETTGTVSFFYYDDGEVIPGLPVLPKVYDLASKEIKSPGVYACIYCGNVENLTAPACCSRCDQEIWVAAIDTKRIA